MKSIAFHILLSIYMACNVCYGWSAELSVQLTGDRLTLEAWDVPLTKILKSLVDQGVRVQIDPRIDSKVTASFINRRIDSAMKSILRSYDYSLIWQQGIASVSEELQLKEIRIFYQGQEQQVRQLVGSTDLKLVTNSDGTSYVRDILLIQVEKNLKQEALDNLLRQLQATVVDAHLPLGIVRLRLPPGSDILTLAENISKYPGITYAEPDFAYPVDGSRRIVDSDLPDLSSPVAPQSSGKTAVAVMDSGLKAKYGSNPYILGTYDAITRNEQLDDSLGHGTQMTLIAAGVVSPYGIEGGEEEITPVVTIRAIDDNGFTTIHTMLQGIDYALAKGAKVMSLSWGSERPSALLESATEYAAVKGLILVAAAGNEPTGIPVYPAAYDNVIGVGALTTNGEPWVQSNYGDFVALQAPGLAKLPVGYQGEPGTYAGTSIATAYTAHRIAAILDETPGADLQTILQKLLAESEIQ